MSPAFANPLEIGGKGAQKKVRHRSQTFSSIKSIYKRSLVTKPFMPHLNTNYIIIQISLYGRNIDLLKRKKCLVLLR